MIISPPFSNYDGFSTVMEKERSEGANMRAEMGPETYPESILEEDAQRRQDDGQQHIYEGVSAPGTDRHLGEMEEEI